MAASPNLSFGLQYLSASPEALPWTIVCCSNYMVEDLYAQQSMTDVLEYLHAGYGDVVRTGPNELHFSNPAAYNDVYNSSARWDKEESLYSKAKQRKDVLQPLVSRRAIINMQGLIREKAGASSCSLVTTAAAIRSIIWLRFLLLVMLPENPLISSSPSVASQWTQSTAFCFAKSIDAMDAPEFKAPIVEAMEAANPTFVLFKHFAP
ncbi:hypothetical protein V1515DRAFT_580140 [Lipomyces mesembrius]